MADRPGPSRAPCVLFSPPYSPVPPTGQSPPHHFTRETPSIASRTFLSIWLTLKLRGRGFGLALACSTAFLFPCVHHHYPGRHYFRVYARLAPPRSRDCRYFHRNYPRPIRKKPRSPPGLSWHRYFVPTGRVAGLLFVDPPPDTGKDVAGTFSNVIASREIFMEAPCGG